MEAVLTLILYHIPEACFFTLSGLGLVGLKVPAKRWLPLVLAFGIIVQVMRRVFFPWHIPLLAIIQAVVQKYYFRISWLTSIGAVFVSLILVNIGEAVLALIVFPLLSLSAERVFNDPVLYVVMGWVTQIPLAVATLGAYQRGWVIIPLHSGDGGAGVEHGSGRQGKVS